MNYLESIMLKSVICEKYNRDIVTIDIPNLFINKQIDKKTGEDEVIMKINGLLVDMLVQMNPEKYCPNVVHEE